MRKRNPRRILLGAAGSVIFIVLAMIAVFGGVPNFDGQPKSPEPATTFDLHAGMKYKDVGDFLGQDLATVIHAIGKPRVDNNLNDSPSVKVVFAKSADNLPTSDLIVVAYCFNLTNSGDTGNLTLGVTPRVDVTSELRDQVAARSAALQTEFGDRYKCGQNWTKQSSTGFYMRG